MMKPKDQPEKLKKIRFNWVPYENQEDHSATFIVHNKVKCNYCGDIIESEYQHDFKQCKCGKTFVDGGHAYIRTGGDNYNELHEHITLNAEEYLHWLELRAQFYKALKDYPGVSEDIPEDWVKSIKAHKDYENRVIGEISKVLSN